MIFMGSAGSFPYLQAPPIGPYHEVAESSTHVITTFLFGSCSLGRSEDPLLTPGIEPRRPIFSGKVGSCTLFNA